MDATWHPRGVTHGMSHVVHLCEWLILSHVSKERNKRKIKKIKKIKKNCGEDMWHVGDESRKVGRKLLHLDYLVDKGKKKAKQKGKEKRK